MADNDYKLILNEEFNKDYIDESIWNIETSPDEVVNSELQEYVNSQENLFIRNNKLYIRPTRIPNSDGTYSYASALLTTKLKKEFTYGRFEARIKIPSGSGLIPFFKLCSDQNRYGVWPIGGQLDIMMIPTRNRNRHYGSIHHGANKVLEQGAYSFKDGDDASDNFHNYACEWLPGVIKFYVDDELFFVSHIDEPFNHPMYISIGMAIGGTLAGPPVMTTVFSDENSMITEYIRVYQKEEYSIPNYSEPRKVVAVCGSWEDAENFNMFLRALQTAEFQEKYIAAAFTFGALEHEDKNINEYSLVDYIGRCHPTSIIVFSQMIHNDQIVDALVNIGNDTGIPVFVFERPHDNAINVLCDYDRGFETTCRHIIEHHGIRNVEMFAGFKDNDFSNRRIEVFRKVLEDNDISFSDSMIHYGDFWDEAAANEMERLLNSGYKVPEAIISANDSMALGLAGILRREKYRIPEDVKLIGFDGIRETSLHHPSISTCTLDYSNFVEELIDILDNWDYLENKSEYYKSGIEINFKPIYRTSCGCVRPETKDQIAELSSRVASDYTDNFRHMYEMSRFISQAVQSDSFYDSLSTLEKYLWLWDDQYYFVGLKGLDNKLRVLFSGFKDEYKKDLRYVNLNKVLPDIDLLVNKDSGINILLFKQVRVHSDDFVYAATGLQKLDLRDEQRFEEFVLFLSTVLDSIYKNQNYLRINKEIERMSDCDYLTGLYNRRGFIKEINSRIRKNSNDSKVLSLFSVDMDGLKYINDTFGHTDGDIAIKVMGEALTQHVGSRGICARYGGDEFAFALITDDTAPIDIKNVHDLLDEIISCNPKVIGKPYQVSASIGYSQRIVDEEFDFDIVLKEADTLMYEDKKRRKSKK